MGRLRPSASTKGQRLAHSSATGMRPIRGVGEDPLHGFANPLSHGRSGTFNAEVRLPRSKFLASLYDTALTVLMSEPMLSSPYRASNSKVRNFDERPSGRIHRSSSAAFQQVC